MVSFCYDPQLKLRPEGYEKSLPGSDPILGKGFCGLHQANNAPEQLRIATITNNVIEIELLTW